MTEDRSLLAALDVLRVGLGVYLQWLQRLWAGDPARPEAQRLLDAVGRAPEPTDAERAAGGAAVEALGNVDGGVLAALSWRLGLSMGDVLLVAAAWWAEVDPQFATVVGCAHDDGARRRPTAALVRTVLAPFGVDVPLAVDDRHPLVTRGVFVAGASAAEALVLTPTAVTVLGGRIPAPLEAPDPPARLADVRAALARRLAEVGGGEQAVTVLRGAAGSGRRAVAVAAAADAGLVALGGDRPVPELRLLARLGVAVPVVESGDSEDGGAEAERAWGAGDGPVVVLASPRHRSPQASALMVDVPGPNVEERAAHWAGRLRTSGAGDVAMLSGELARRFRFTEVAIDASVARAARRADWDGRAVTAADVWAAARRQPEHDLERLATLVTPVWTLDDLVVGPRVRAQLLELLAHVARQDDVLDGWGFRRRLPRGQGVAALFSGPPGTGKTMAAEAVAHALHHDLYRVDLAAVVSKWLGETEKNLAAAFDEAERSGAVLLFDEADALFGKRTEVHDARDRYANLEVNYLLQRVEAFTGLVILATNRKSSLDEAFTRRLRFMVSFDMPGPADRRLLWPRSFPTEASRDDLDWDALAAGELAGASIQAVALSAAFLAVSDGGRITPAHVEAALVREYEKLGRAFPGLPARAAAASTPTGRAGTAALSATSGGRR